MQAIQGLAQSKLRRLPEYTIAAMLGARRDGRRGRGGTIESINLRATLDFEQKTISFLF